MSSREQRREAIEKASRRVNSGNGFVQRKDDEKYGRNLQEVYAKQRALPDEDQRVATLGDRRASDARKAARLRQAVWEAATTMTDDDLRRFVDAVLEEFHSDDN